jgi:hypothetical protein
VAARRLVPPLIVAISVSASTFAFLTVLGSVLSMQHGDGSAGGSDATSIALAAGALMAWLVARSPSHAGPREHADIFGERLQAAVATLYATTAALAILPIAFVAVLILNPDLADVATFGLLVAASAIAWKGVRVGLRARPLSGVWRPFEDAALAAVARGHISDLDERLLRQPLDVVVANAGALRDYRGLISQS